MIESAAYELIKEEGRAEGRAEGLREGLEKGRAEGLREGLLEGILLGLELKFGAEGLRVFTRVRGIEDVGVLEVLHHALRDVDSVEEFEHLVRQLAES